MSQSDFLRFQDLLPKTEIEDPENATVGFEYCLPPIVIPLERVKLEPEENESKSNLFDGSNSTNQAAIPASNIDNKQLTSDLELMIRSRRCPICKAPPFKETFFVAVHILRHFEVKLYRCADCDKRFRYGSLLSAHQQKYHNAFKSHRRNLDPGSRTCTVCDKMFRDRRTFASHMLVRHSKSLSKQQIGQLQCEKDVRKKQTPKQIQCPFCQIHFLTILQLAKHLVQNHRHVLSETNNMCTRPFNCDFDGCHKSYFNKKGLKRHQHVHQKQSVPKKPANFACEMEGCDKMFSNKKALKRHQKDMCIKNSKNCKKCKTVHGVSGCHVCPLCDTKHPFSCNKVPEMCRHLISEHSNLIPTKSTKTISVENDIDQCPYCDCDDFTDFTLHILHHFKVRLFKCTFCSEQFYQYLQLVHHHQTVLKSKRIAKNQAVLFFEYAPKLIYFCPTKNERLNKLKRKIMRKRNEDKTGMTECGQYDGHVTELRFVHSPKNQSQSSHTIELVTLHFSMYSESIPTANLIDRMSCPMCHKLFPFDQLLQHLGGTDLKISFDASGLLTTNEMSHPSTLDVSHGGSHLNLPAPLSVPSLAPKTEPVHLIPFKSPPDTEFVLVQPNKSHEATQQAPQLSNTRPSIPNRSSSSTPGPSYTFDAESHNRVMISQWLIRKSSFRTSLPY